MKYYAHNTVFSGPNKDIPVISEGLPMDDENWHEASEKEYAAYVDYWDQMANDGD